jgi:hypothetical protein
MVSFLQRVDSGIKAFRNPILKPTTKYYGDYSLYDNMGGLSVRNGDILYSEQGAAQAHGVNVGVNASVRFVMSAIGLLTLQVLDEKGGVIWDDTQIPPADANEFEGANLVIAMHDFHRVHKHDYLSSIVFSDLIFGETYTFTKANSLSQNTVLEWVNPLHITPNINQGMIVDFRISSEKGFGNVPLDAIAYRIYNRNPFNDLRGLSPVLSAIEAINIERNTKRAISNYFANGMILGGVISPIDDVHLSPQELDKMYREIRRGNSGVAKAFSWVFTPVRMNIESFKADDMDKHYEIVKSTRDEIFIALNVPKELVGASDTLSYENAEPVMRNWLKVQGRSYANSQLGYLNDSLLPKFAPDSKVRFAYDFTQIDRRDATLVHADLKSGIITLGQAAKERGLEVDETIADVLSFNGIPYTGERLLAIANGEVVSTTVKPDGSSTTSGGENNDPQELSDIPTEQVFGYHIDSGIVTINEARAQIGLLPKSDEAVDELQALQAQFSVMATANQAGIPAAISAQMVGLEIPEVEQPALPAPTETPSEDGKEETQPEPEADKHVHFDGHDISVVKFEPLHATPLDELIVWKRVVNKNSKKVFDPVHLRGDLGDTIQLGLDTAKGDIKATRAVFDIAKIALAFKAIQATRLDFEGDYDNLLTRARDEKMGRVQWASAMRSIIRRYGRRAFSDGLIEGGIGDGNPSEEDQDRIVELIANSSQYVTKLGNVLYKEDGISDTLADNKAAVWWNRTMQIFFDDGLLSADKNGMYEFTGPVKEGSCSTCRRMKGQRHRLKDYARKGMRPKTDGDNFDCGGFECVDRLVKVNARERGNW